MSSGTIKKSTSILENIAVNNAATGRKKYFDLYPITFREFLRAFDDKALHLAHDSCSFEDPPTAWQHARLTEVFQDYLRLGALCQSAALSYWQGV